MKKEIRLSGSGGQGLILAGIILASAAMKAGKNVVQTQSYGPEARGGASKAEVIISSEEIYYPKVVNPHIMLAMTQEACDKYVGDLKEDGILLIDSTYVKNLPNTSAKIFSLPITQLAKNQVGKVIVSNMVALGALIGLTEVLNFKELEEAVLERIPMGTEEINKKALYLGYNAARNELGIK